jgi:excinuclease ABC subunit A
MHVPDAYSYNTGEKMVSYSDEQIKTLIVGQWSIRKGHYGELFNKSQVLKSVEWF